MAEDSMKLQFSVQLSDKTIILEDVRKDLNVNQEKVNNQPYHS